MTTVPQEYMNAAMAIRTRMDEVLDSEQKLLFKALLGKMMSDPDSIEKTTVEMFEAADVCDEKILRK